MIFVSIVIVPGSSWHVVVLGTRSVFRALNPPHRLREPVLSSTPCDIYHRPSFVTFNRSLHHAQILKSPSNLRRLLFPFVPFPSSHEKQGYFESQPPQPPPVPTPRSLPATSSPQRCFCLVDLVTAMGTSTSWIWPLLFTPPFVRAGASI